MPGTTFWNRIQMTPLRDAKSNQISFFVGIQYEVSDPSLISNPPSSTSLLALTALSVDRMGVVMGGRGMSHGHGISQNNNNHNHHNNRLYHTSSYSNNAMGGYSDGHPHTHTHTHLPSQLRGPNHHGLLINGGLEGGSSGGDYGMMMGLGQHQSFADDRSASKGTYIFTSTYPLVYTKTLFLIYSRSLIKSAPFLLFNNNNPDFLSPLFCTLASLLCQAVCQPRGPHPVDTPVRPRRHVMGLPKVPKVQHDIDADTDADADHLTLVHHFF